jgi:hypothetical protein
VPDLANDTVAVSVTACPTDDALGDAVSEVRVSARRCSAAAGVAIAANTPTASSAAAMRRFHRYTRMVRPHDHLSRLGRNGRGDLRNMSRDVESVYLRHHSGESVTA